MVETVEEQVINLQSNIQDLKGDVLDLLEDISIQDLQGDVLDLLKDISKLMRRAKNENQSFFDNKIFTRITRKS